MYHGDGGKGMRRSKFFEILVVYGREAQLQFVKGAQAHKMLLILFVVAVG